MLYVLSLATDNPCGVEIMEILSSLSMDLESYVRWSPMSRSMFEAEAHCQSKVLVMRALYMQ